MFDFEIETYKNANNLQENAMCLIFAKMCKGQSIFSMKSPWTTTLYLYYNYRFNLCIVIHHVICTYIIELKCIRQG
jgi:hypothetical protein